MNNKKYSNREAHIRKKNTTTMIILAIALVFIFLSQTELGGEIADLFFYEDTPVVDNRPAAAPEAGEEMLVYYFDVDQGDSELIRIPESTSTDGYFDILIDTGVYDEYKNLKAYLMDLQVTELEAVVVTHPHADHMGSMATVIEDFGIGKFYMPAFPESLTPTSVAYEKMLDSLMEKDLGITVIKEGTVIEATDTASVTVMGPTGSGDYDDLNNYSAIIKVVYGDTSFLFTGDAETPEFQEAIDGGWNLDSDVLKVGHHGSWNSTDKNVMDAVSPSLAIISCGEGNSYGHPHDEVIDLLEDYSVPYYRTDYEGTILVSSDGAEIKKVS